MNADGLWQRLGTAPTNDPAAIRRAYARKLKEIDPEADPQAFIALRDALQAALARAAHAAVQGEPGEPEVEAPASEAEPRAPERAVPSPELPRLDEAPLRRIEALLFGDGAEGQPGEMEAAAAALLADPALEQVDISRQVEALLAQWIVQGAPRSEPLIDPAAAFFHWDAAASEIRRAPLVEAVLRFREDRFFAAQLGAKGQRPYRRLFDSLKAPPKPMGAFARWRLVPYVSNFLAYCRLMHPSLLHMFHPETLAGWEGQFAALRSGKGLGARIARLRRRDIVARGVLWSERPSPSPRLWLGVFILPFLCAWFLLRPGHSWTGRLIGFTWFAVILIGVAGQQDESPRPQPGVPWNRFSYVAPEKDIDPLLATMAPGKLTLADLAKRNPELARKLVAMWDTAGKNGTEISDFDAAAGRLLDDSYRAALRGGGYEVEAAYWRVEAEKLRWLEARSASECDAYMGAGAHPGFPEALYGHMAATVAGALEAGPSDPPALPPPGGKGSIAIPGPLVAAAAKRAGLAMPVMLAVLGGGGTQAQHCAARIALIEEALAQPRKTGEPLLRRLSATL